MQVTLFLGLCDTYIMKSMSKLQIFSESEHKLMRNKMVLNIWLKLCLVWPKKCILTLQGCKKYWTAGPWLQKFFSYVAESFLSNNIIFSRKIKLSAESKVSRNFWETLLFCKERNRIKEPFAERLKFTIPSAER